jgi:hypothetical protein
MRYKHTRISVALLGTASVFRSVRFGLSRVVALSRVQHGVLSMRLL